MAECHELDVYQVLLKHPFAGGTSLEATSNVSFQIIAVQNASQRRHLPSYLCKYVMEEVKYVIEVRYEKVRSINANATVW